VEKEEEEMFSEGDEAEFDQMEKEAKYMKDDYSSSEDEAKESQEDENAQFLAHGHDLDLPEESSDEEEESGDESDKELQEYYEELGIAEEMAKSKKSLYKQTKKQKAKKSGDKPVRDREVIIDAIIANCKNQPTFKNVSRIIKMTKAIFIKVEEEDKKEKDKVARTPSTDKQLKFIRSLNTQEYSKIFEFFARDLPGLVIQVTKINA
jgi:hypothetical protein